MIEVWGHAELTLTVWGCESPEEAHAAALEYIDQFEGSPWENCVMSRWNELDMGEYLVKFTAQASDLTRR